MLQTYITLRAKQVAKMQALSLWLAPLIGRGSRQLGDIFLLCFLLLGACPKRNLITLRY